MLHRSFIVCLLTIGGILVGMSSLEAQQSLTLERSGPAGSPGTPIEGFGSADLDLLLTNTAPVEGYVAAVAFDNTAISISEISTAGTVTESSGAELVVSEILATGITIGVVLDAAAPFDGQTIAAGTDQLLAVITATSILLLGQGDPPVTTALTFQDGILNNPPLDNIIVQGGLSVGAPTLGLDDANAMLTIGPPPPDSLTIEDTSYNVECDANPAQCVRILLNNQSGAVQGFVLAISHDPMTVSLDDINITGTATEMAGAEFVTSQILANGGTLGVVLDFNAPFGGQAIPIGQNNHIANYCYQASEAVRQSLLYFPGDLVPAPVVTDLTFADGVFGTPPLNNVIVVSGLSLTPAQINGQLTIEPPIEPCPVEDTSFFCGPRSYEGTFDPKNNPAPPIEGSPGDDVEICLFYTDSDDNLQGLQMALCFDCNLIFNDFDLTDSIFDEVGAEFVNWNIDNDPNDGDGCEFVLGILLDALPPFDGQTVPPTDVPLLVGCIAATIDPEAPCDTCLPVEFCNGINGAGQVLIENIAIVDFESLQDFQLVDCEVCVIPEPIFRRGDCNDDDKVDLADAAKILGWQFQGEPINCPDACDANNDGKINLADSVLLMNYLFKMGTAPPDPGPENDGPDEGEDDLPECMNGTSC